jgi:hypothetical protein
MPRTKYDFHIDNGSIYKSRRGTKVRGVSNSFPTLGAAKSHLREYLSEQIALTKLHLDGISKVRASTVVERNNY